MQHKKVELLAPAGSYESMKAAVTAGADAIYMGGSQFGARAYADNPDQDQLLDAIRYVHLHDRKLYLTINTLMKESELEQELYPFLKPYYEAGVDAVIVQDLGVFLYIKKYFCIFFAFHQMSYLKSPYCFFIIIPHIKQFFILVAM